ncbi:MAG: hypothetical protein K8R56_03020, partial [Candidatus Eisenbacteria bacterium]|nr:hypothetical protein [Candidatus Eisenbacteria bacterium]
MTLRRPALAALALTAVALCVALAAQGQPVQVSPEQRKLQSNLHIDPERVPMRASISPSPARLGQSLTYRAMVLVPPRTQVRFETPQSGGEFTWGKPRAGREKAGWVRSVSEGYDSLWFEAKLQVFETGTIAVPGPGVRFEPMPGTARSGRSHLPTVHIVVVPTLTAADSNADLRGLHGPLRAPWYERVPWAVLVVAVLLLVAVALLVRYLMRRKPKPRAVRPVSPSLAAPRLRLDPAAEALRAIAALRTRELPQTGRFGEHALELTAILRRFLEATVTTPRPGDTSGELLVRLRESRLDEADLERLEGLLSLWDRVKFARAP